MIIEHKLQWERLPPARRCGEVLRRPLGYSGKPRICYGSGKVFYICRVRIKQWHIKKYSKKMGITFRINNIIGTGETISAARHDIFMTRKELSWNSYTNTLSKHNPCRRGGKGIWAHRYKGNNQEYEFV